MQLPSIIKLADSAVGRKLASWRKTAMNSCMLVAAAMLAVTSGGLKIVIILFQAYGLVIESLGNLKIPAALLRVVLAALHLAEPTGDYGDGGDTTNLVPSLAIFYVTVLGQGILYIVPCVLQVFSFILQRSLARRAGLRDELLQAVASQALAVLAMESPRNCLAMSEEPGYVFIKELTTMIHVGRCRYIAASLLQNMCVHARSKLSKADLKELSNILPKVLEGIMNTDGAELKVLAGLSSQICIAIPGDFARELERGQNKERFIKRLVNSLNANMNTASHCPGVRRAVVEQAVCMMECSPAYTECFIKCGMMEVLVMAEHKHFKAKDYRYFSGDVGLMEHNVPLSALVARAKELMRGNGLFWDS
uniref:Uncharacterized protein n=1 Tax=Avena sativa TaxID=4498 RepID=A0ACD5T8B5_AVESA